jgi:branched-chain amino acid transport system substrate-binding protein
LVASGSIDLYQRGMELKSYLSLGALIGLSFLVGCGGESGPPEAKIGFIAELTGEMPAVGASSRNAATMRVAKINQDGGLKLPEGPVKVRLLTEDNNAKADQSASAAQKLINQDGVLALVGPNASLGAIPASEIAEANQTLMITPWSTNPKTTLDARTNEPKKWVFRSCFIDPFQAKVLAKFALTELNLKNAAVLYDVASEAPNGQAKLFREVFEKKGGNIVAFETYTTGDKDFSAQLTKIKSANPELIYLPAYYTDVPLVVEQARRQGIDAIFLGSDAWSSPELIKLAGNSVEGSYLTNHYSSDVATPVAREFIDAYTKRYGQAPDDVAALTYDTFGVLFAAIEKAGKLDRTAVRDALTQIPPFEGVTGTIRFEDGSGDPIKSAVILKIEDGKFTWLMNAQP